MIGPLALVLAMGAFSPVAVIYAWRAIVGRRKATHLCYDCRFDLRSLPASIAVCPECGARILKPGSRPPMPARDRVWFAARAIVLFLPLAFVGSYMWKVFRARQGLSAGSQGAAATTLTDFLKGSGSTSSMKRAVGSYVQDLAPSEPGRSYSQPREGPWLITGSYHAQATSVVARLLDDPNVDADRRAAFLAALLDEYRRTPLQHSTQADEILCDLLSGVRGTHYGGSSSDYVPASPTPRSIDSSEASLIIEALLEIQADATRSWSPHWGVGIEKAWARGLATKPQIERYIEHSFAPKLIIYPDLPPRAGDIVHVQVHPRWRSGSGIPVLFSARARDPAWRDRLIGPVTRPLKLYQSAGGSLIDDCSGLLLLPDSPGKHRFQLEATVSVGPDVMEVVKSTFSFAGDEENLPTWKAIPALSYSTVIEVELDLEPSASAPVRFDDLGIAPIDLGLTTSIRAVPESNGSAEILMFVWAKNRTIDLAFEAALRQDGREFPLGWSMKRRFETREGMCFLATITGLDVQRPVDVVLRSAQGPLARPAVHPVFWNGQIEFQSQPIHIRKQPADLDAWLPE